MSLVCRLIHRQDDIGVLIDTCKYHVLRPPKLIAPFSALNRLLIVCWKFLNMNLFSYEKKKTVVAVESDEFIMNSILISFSFILL